VRLEERQSWDYESRTCLIRGRSAFGDTGLRIKLTAGIKDTLFAANDQSHTLFMSKVYHNIITFPVIFSFLHHFHYYPADSVVTALENFLWSFWKILDFIG